MPAAASTRWSIAEYGGRDALRRLETDWRRLSAAMDRRTAFHTFDANAAYLDHLMPAPERFRCLVLSDGHAARAICPLEHRIDRVLGVPLPVWGTPFGPHWPFSDVICPEDDARAALVPALARYLRRRAAGAPLLVLGPLPRRSVLWDGLAELGSPCYASHVPTRPFVFDCELPFDELMGRLSKHFRKQLRNYGNRLRALPGVRFESAAGDEAASLFEAFLTVEASGWKGTGGTGSAIRLDLSRLAFYRALAHDFGHGDGCEINALFAEDRCIAAELCIRAGESYAALKIGYDEDYARLSPGHLLHAHTLERCCQDPGIRRYDQLSDAGWLAAWRPDKTVLRQAYVPLGRWSGPPLAAALRLRFGPGRQAVRRLRAWSRDVRDARDARRAARPPGRDARGD